MLRRNFFTAAIGSVAALFAGKTKASPPVDCDDMLNFCVLEVNGAQVEFLVAGKVSATGWRVLNSDHSSVKFVRSGRRPVPKVSYRNLDGVVHG